MWDSNPGIVRKYNYKYRYIIYINETNIMVHYASNIWCKTLNQLASFHWRFLYPESTEVPTCSSRSWGAQLRSSHGSLETDPFCFTTIPLHFCVDHFTHRFSCTFWFSYTAAHLPSEMVSFSSKPIMIKHGGHRCAAHGVSQTHRKGAKKTPEDPAKRQKISQAFLSEAFRELFVGTWDDFIVPVVE